MVQLLLLSSLLRGSGTGVMVVILFAVGLIALAVTGNSTLAGIMSAAVSIFFLLLIILAAMHVARFFLVAALSAAVAIKRLTRRF